MSLDTSIPTADTVDPRRLSRKVLLRIVPLIFIAYIIAYLDRANVSYAKLVMKDSLGFSESQFGLGFGTFFFAGYLLLQIPGALLVEHASARRWFALILFVWGFCSMATAFVKTPMHFYVTRCLLGVAEAGFFPGVIVYFTHWFPRADRGRAMAGLLFAIPLCMALGALFSGLLLEVDWLELEGWQWVFLIEGFPALVLSVLVFIFLSDRPRDARWLTPAERDWLETTLASERREAAKVGRDSLAHTLRQPTVWLLALGILLTNTGGYGLQFWLPTALKGFLTAIKPDATATEVLTWTSLVYLCGLPAVCLAGWSSDRSGDRKWHCAAGMFLYGLFLALSTLATGTWYWPFACLCAAVFFAFFWPPPFWVLPTLTLSASAAAVSISFVNICASIAGMIGPPLVGRMKDLGYNDGVCLLALSGFMFLGGVSILLLRVPRTAALKVSAPVPELNGQPQTSSRELTHD